ncbi:MAG: hypothetical protein NUW14_03705 [Deltaproteobacteria bacterium]|nr:hypothetical protein [Deltaproteobacteria bacterium]
MNVEVLYFEGCPNHVPAVDMVAPDVMAFCDQREEGREDGDHE